MGGSLEFPRPSSNNPGERKFPGGSVLMAMRFPEGFDFGQGTRIPQAVQCGQKKNTLKTKSRKRWADPRLTHHSLSNQVFTKHQ